LNELKELKETVHVDGSFLEGGGQILRSSVALSCITKQPVEINNIRAERRNPGLAAQHLTGIGLAAKMSKASVEGLRPGSKELIFSPEKIAGGMYSANVGTAGSITLVLQSAVPVAAFSDSKTNVMISGGTDVLWSPPVDYTSNVVFPVLSKMGFSCSLKTKKRGYYPRGGGLVKFWCLPAKELKPVDFSLGLKEKDFKVVRGISHCAGLPEDIAERQAKSAGKALEEVFGDVIIDIEAAPKNRSQTIGSGITLWLESKNAVIGSSSLGAQGKPAEKVGAEAAEILKKTIESKCPVDEHASDQLLIFMALARGRSCLLTDVLSSHSKTNMYIIEKFLPVKFKTEETDCGILISVEGAGVKNPDFK